MMQSQKIQPESGNLFQRLVRGQFGLALTYWVFFLIASVAFFIGGSMAVADRDWHTYLILLGALLVWTFLLLLGVKQGFRGEDPGKALGRVAVLFLLLDMTNALAVISFF